MTTEREHDEVDGCRVFICFEEALPNGFCAKHKHACLVCGGALGPNGLRGHTCPPQSQRLKR